mmetsp:Transcript_11475/g.29344  ORF Transcript_11475/g.29344 Transcript_11475/m.29344 type:complete len:423 (-) Transcript_11475:166-1434(-)|eukprot:CAMPEP_0182928034 /NCGR_PEP_ID=MMETSP0105_2-20130417/14984_1 /TAXON_ID=81532 ORGANISM="Acanthoeca-like sp., Strain 10tr" /NCGR_SAMPLE_ID=MMETSP0105_2 /ASSEMBLY_ACC=CAM_ASM_000205 /LENGTH=422 /DNA_ID=CAMNT_0025066021 /DNA_START=75 /DNA_END=1343 /DNA_ORIENTATION=+
MGQTISLERAELRMLEMGLESWRNGLVGATADCHTVTFDVPVGSGFRVPSRDAEGGVEALDQPLHIHTALCKPTASLDSHGDESGATSVALSRVAEVDWEANRQSLTVSDGIPCVLMHGYGSGIGIYSAMLPGMAAAYSGAVYAIDTLGCGLSSRPAVTGHWTDLTVRQSEDFFVTGIERWRKAMGFEKVNLVGHSVGGYLAVTYAERYPDNVNQVVTIGCAGVPDKPVDLEDRLRRRYPWAAPVAINIWNKGISPFNIMRWGPGNAFFSRYARRWEGLPWLPEIDRLKDYLHANWTQHEVSAGGYAHYTLLSFAAYARDPLFHRIPKIRLDKPVRMIYGEGDWMNPGHADELRDSLTSDGDSLGGAVSDGSVAVEVARVQHGGHNVVVENPTGTIQAVVDALVGRSVDRKVYAGLVQHEPP